MISKTVQIIWKCGTCTYFKDNKCIYHGTKLFSPEGRICKAREVENARI